LGGPACSSMESPVVRKNDHAKETNPLDQRKGRKSKRGVTNTTGRTRTRGRKRRDKKKYRFEIVVWRRQDLRQSPRVLQPRFYPIGEGNESKVEIACARPTKVSSSEGRNVQIHSNLKGAPSNVIWSHSYTLSLG